ncbi:hypothetical protein FF38_12771 [Lucilia cuprina]|uniref:Uncharacterized protein n=1 Tax=Lucilia cuprina TaxID=7375 RepID=A0A0L0CJ94_LUCCU|nr:hypothetical protein FF38_12771 [Lucilia cuprina]
MFRSRLSKLVLKMLNFKEMRHCIYLKYPSHPTQLHTIEHVASISDKMLCLLSFFNNIERLLNNNTHIGYITWGYMYIGLIFDMNTLVVYDKLTAITLWDKKYIKGVAVKMYIFILNFDCFSNRPTLSIRTTAQKFPNKTKKDPEGNCKRFFEY